MAAPILGHLQIDIDSRPAVLAIQRLGQLTSQASRTKAAIQQLGAASLTASSQLGTLGLRMTSLVNSMQAFNTAFAKSVTGIGQFATGTNAANAAVAGLSSRATRSVSPVAALSTNMRTAATNITAAGAAATRATSATTNMGSAARRAQGEYVTFANRSRDATQGFMSVVLRLALVFGGLRASMASLQTIATFEDFRDTFTALRGGDAALGNADFEFARKYARESAQTFEEVASAIIGLRNSGYNPTREMLRVFSDVAAATTDQRATFPAAVRLWQRAAGGGLGVEELDILANRGASVYPITQERLGVGRRGIGDLGQDREGATRIVTALGEGWRERYGGLTDRRVDNLTVRWNAFTDAMKAAAEQIGVGLGNAIKDTLDVSAERLDKNAEAFRKLGEGVGYLADKVTSLITGFAALHNATSGVSSWLIGFAGMAAVLAGLIHVIKLVVPFGTLANIAAKPFVIANQTRAMLKQAKIGINEADLLWDNSLMSRKQRIWYMGDIAAGIEPGDAGIPWKDRILKQRPGASALGKGYLGASAVVLGADLSRPFRDGPTGRGILRTDNIAKAFRGVTTAARAMTNPFTAVAAGAAAAGVALFSLAESRGDADKTWWDSFTGNMSSATTAVGKFAAWIESYIPIWDFTKDTLGSIPRTFGYAATALGHAADALAFGVMWGNPFGGNYPGWREGDTPLSYFRRRQTLGTNAMMYEDDPLGMGTGDAQAIQALGFASGVNPYGRGAMQPYLEFQRGRVGQIRSSRAVTAQELRDRQRQRGLDFLAARDEWELSGEDGSEFREYIQDEWKTLARQVVISSDTATASVKNFTRNLGEELHARVIDHAIGKPFRDLMTSVLDQIFEAITDRKWWTEGAGSGLGGLLGNLADFWRDNADGGVLSSAPSASAGGYTGFMSGPGVDGRGGRPWILHDDEYIVPGDRYRNAGGPIVINNYAPGVSAQARREGSGKEMRTIVDIQVAEALANGPRTKKAMKAGYGQSQKAR